MFKAIEGRNPLGVLVGGYRNLATKDPARQWSWRALEGKDKGKKVAEGDSATLLECGVYVRESTRERLLAARANPGEGKGDKGFREVHAWVTGYLLADDVIAPADDAPRITYRPFDRPDFFYADTGETFTRAYAVTFHTDARVYLAT